jgi:hypothetical protein
LPGSKRLAQARKDGTFSTVHEAFWAAARARCGDRDGTRLLIEVLLLHRRMPRAAVLAGIRAALGAGSVSPELVAIEARKPRGTSDPASPPPLAPRRSAAQVVTLHARRRARDLPEDARAAPSVAHYDQLLTHPATASSRRTS